MEPTGFAITGYDILGRYFTQAHFKKIREWGFNTVLITFWWSFFEDEETPGEYNQQNLQIFKEGIQKARNEGLEVILSGRVCYDPVSMPDWAGWSTHDYVNLSGIGRDRYAKLWGFLVQEFPDCIYCPWHFPYHRQGVDWTRSNTYHNTTFPRILEEIRKYSQNQVVYSPVHQGDADEGSTWYEYNEPYDDPKLVYGLGHLIPWYVTDQGQWDYDHARMDRAFQGVKRWREEKRLPMISIEYAPLYWSGDVHPSRIECLKESMSRMRKYGVGYMSWRISLYQAGSDNILRNMEQFEPNQDIFDVIKPEENGNGNGNGNGEEEFPWKWIALTLGVVAIIYFTKK